MFNFRIIINLNNFEILGLKWIEALLEKNHWIQLRPIHPIQKCH